MKPKIVLSIDFPWWISGQYAMSMQRYLSSDYDFEIIAQDKIVQKKVEVKADLLIWLIGAMRNPPLGPKRNILHLCSHTSSKKGIGFSEDYNTIVCWNREIYECWKDKHDNVYFIPQPVDLKLWYPPPEKKYVSSPFVVGWCGNQKAERKCISTILIPALEQMEKEGAMRLFLHNGGPYRDWKWLREEFYWKIDLLAITSSVEGGPAPLLEAMACGVPVVSTSVGSVPDIIRHGTNGWIVDGKPESFEKFFHMILRKREYFLEVKKRVSVFRRDWRWAAVRWKEVIDRVLEL